MSELPSPEREPEVCEAWVECAYYCWTPPHVSPDGRDYRYFCQQCKTVQILDGWSEVVPMSYIACKTRITPYREHEAALRLGASDLQMGFVLISKRSTGNKVTEEIAYYVLEVSGNLETGPGQPIKGKDYNTYAVLYQVSHPNRDLKDMARFMWWDKQRGYFTLRGTKGS